MLAQAFATESPPLFRELEKSSTGTPRNTGPTRFPRHELDWGEGRCGTVGASRMA